MKPRNFVFVVGAAVLAALVLTMVVSCGSNTPDCPCEGEDFYAEHYAECVRLCDAARAWGEGCGHPPMAADCVGFLWDQWTEPVRCRSAAECYGVLAEVADCREGTHRFEEEGWQPPTWPSGCPAESP